MKEQLLKYYIIKEIANKFLIRPYKLIDKEVCYTSQFSLTDVKMIKNIIGQELVGHYRPKVSAVILKKNVTVTLKSSIGKKLLTFLQKKPMIWSENLYSTSNISESFFKGVFVIKNNKWELVVSNKRISKIDLMVKSAYFD